MTGKELAASSGNAVGQAAGGRPEAQEPSDGAEAVRDLFRDHHLELVRLAAMMLGDVAAAEDIVQDAFERLHRHWRGVREPSSGLAYARSCVLNGCRTAHRRVAVARRYAPRLAGQPRDSRDPVAAIDDTAQVMAALRLLTRRQREVIVLRYYADQDVAEIAETLRISPGAVRAVMNRALAVLGRALGED